MQNEKLPERKDFCATPEINALIDEIMRLAKITAICAAIIIGIIITVVVIILICRHHRKKAESDLKKNINPNNEGEETL